jgi:ABC-type branched-subunit amino acid transport system substrate-binding protein
MTYTPTRIAAILTTALLAVGAAACGKSDENDAAGATKASSKGAPKTGPGVTATAIRLGVLTDTSGVFAGLGGPLVDGNRLFWKLQNDKGGVCGRQVELVVKDHGYDPQRGVSLYREIEPNVLALNQLLGSPVAAALLPSIQQDGMLTALAAWPSSLTANPNVIVAGATYDIEAINGIDHLVETGALHKGDKLGHVYFEGEYGENALQGSKYAAERQGLGLVEQKIKPTDTDLSAQVAALKRAGVKAILISAGPKQTASLAGVAAASGLDVPVVANAPGFDPALLATPAAPALKKNLTMIGGTAPYAADAPGATEVSDAYLEHFPKGAPKYSVDAGYAESKLMFEVLQRACDANDLTRAGLVKALRGMDAVDTGGLVAGTLDFSKLGVPPSRSVYLSKVDAKAPGGLSVIGDASESANATAYEVPAS